jgi:hypothetical protein
MFYCYLDLRADRHIILAYILHGAAHLHSVEGKMKRRRQRLMPKNNRFSGESDYCTGQRRRNEPCRIICTSFQ